MKKELKIRENFSFQNMFWLFMIANVIGVILEGVWTVFKFGRWETHVVCIWGPFCLLYGAGAIAFYGVSILVQKKNPFIQFIGFAVAADLLEYICGWMLEAGLGMKAWTYKKHFMNLQGRISLQMTIIWGGTGIVYFYLLVPRIISLFEKMKGNAWRYVCFAGTIFMIVNMTATVACLVRWSQRHYGKKADNQIEKFIDRTYDDNRMSKLFCEWWFMDEGKEFWKEYKK